MVHMTLLSQRFFIESVVYVESATISVYVETPHLFNIFSESVGVKYHLQS